MATEAVPQLLGTSVDSAGLSVISSRRTAADPRQGAMYNPLALAAGVPVHFHALQTGEYIGLLRSHWFNATVGTHGPQSYTSHSEGGSVWVKITPPQGETEVLGQIRAGLTLNGAASTGEFLYTVGALEDGTASVQHHRIGPGGTLMSVGEDVLLPITAQDMWKKGAPGDMPFADWATAHPFTDWQLAHPSYPDSGVFFDKGCYIDRPYLVVLGTDADANVYTARRKLSRIGALATYRNALIGEGTPEERTVRLHAPGIDPWEYQGSKGWLSDPYYLEPIGLTSLGPVSVAKFRDRLVVSTVAQVAGIYLAKVFQSRATDPFGRWRPDPLSDVPLGDFSSYLGGTLYFQDQLGRNPAMPVVEGSVTAIPCVSSVRSVAGSEHSISTTWELWSIRPTV